MKKAIFFIIISFLLIGCVTTDNNLITETKSSSVFTTDNIMKVYQGMSSNEIIALFGKPKNVRVSTCGMSPNQWTCTTWEYGRRPCEWASFTFTGNHNTLILNDFDINAEPPIVSSICE